MDGLMLRFILFSFLILNAAPALAQEGGWVSASEIQARLIAASPQSAALQMRVSPGWHSYWRSSGDTGLPPRFDWTGSENLKESIVQYPVPMRFDEMGLTVFGYDGDVTFPLDIAATDTAKPVKLALKLDTMVCKEICVPQTLNLTLDISDQNHEAAAPLIEFARNKVPQAKDHPALKLENAITGPDALVMSIFSQTGFKAFDVFVETKNGALTAKPEITPDDKDPRYAQIRIAAPQGTKNLMESLAGSDLRITLTNGNAHIETLISY